MKSPASSLTLSALAGALLAIAMPCTAESLRAGERPAAIAALPGVVAADATWELVWADFKTADGLVPMPDGGILFAQEQTDTIRRLDGANHEMVYLANTQGTGAVSFDAQGRLFGVQRTCTDSARPYYQSCALLTNVAMLAPQYRLLANSFADGRPLGRVNDVMADGKGGAYFTVGGVYHVTEHGVVTVVAEQDIRTNGLLLSADGKTLWVTNTDRVVAFDVAADGSTTNRRDFGALAGDTGADGMAVDADGRLYVTASQGVHVLNRDGTHLGLIPTPRVPISLCFAGPGKKTLYVAQMGAVGPDGKPWNTPQGVRNTAMTLYRLPMLAAGYAGRPK
jgi:gluconolactonase